MKTLSFKEQIMFKDKYARILSRQVDLTRLDQSRASENISRIVTSNIQRLSYSLIGCIFSDMV